MKMLDADDEIVESLRKEAIRARLYASACEDAHQKAMEELWRGKLFDKRLFEAMNR